MHFSASSWSPTYAFKAIFLYKSILVGSHFLFSNKWAEKKGKWTDQWALRWKFRERKIDEGRPISEIRLCHVSLSLYLGSSVLTFCLFYFYVYYLICFNFSSFLFYFFLIMWIKFSSYSVDYFRVGLVFLHPFNDCGMKCCAKNEWVRPLD